MYEDGRCRRRAIRRSTAQAVSVNAVRAKPYTNVAPAYSRMSKMANDIPDGEGINREVEENSAAGTDVGAPVVATDPGRDGPDVLTYTLGTSNDDDWSVQYRSRYWDR